MICRETSMAYTYSHGFRMVVPYLHTTSTRVKGAWAGKKVKEVVEELMPYLSSERIQLDFDENRVLVNGTPTHPSHLLSMRESLGYTTHWHEPAVLDEPIRVQHVDRDLIVVNKPSSIPVHPISRFRLNTVMKIVKKEHPELLEDGDTLNVVHRIDRLASGLLLLAKTTKATSQLSSLFHQRLVKKKYLARVKGVFPDGVVKVSEPITMLKEQPVVYGVCQLGKSSCTIFERESVSADRTQSIVRCQPVTGRSHQIRVHLQWLGHPIANDYKYGGDIDMSSVPSFIPEPEGYAKMEWCCECRQGRRDTSNVSWEDLHVNSIWLHSLRYTSTHPKHSWMFETPRPPWADFHIECSLL